MTMLVVGLFEERSDAQAALQDLVSSGYDRGGIEVKESYSPEARSGDLSDLSDELRGFGVPERDTRAYVSGMKTGDTLVYLQTDDDRADLARDILNRHGAIDIYHAHEVRTGSVLPAAAAATGAATAGVVSAASTTHTTPAVSTTTTTAATAHTGTRGANEVAIPVVEEQLTVGKREVQRGGALIHTYVTERPVEETVTLREEHVTVERHPVNRPVESADDSFREATIDVTETAEEAVVAKQARVVEEVVVNKEATERTETIRDTVRRTDVDVEELDNDDVTTTTAGTTTTTNSGRI